MSNTMTLRKLSFNICYPIEVCEIGGLFTFPGFYNDLVETGKSSLILSQDFKFPDDFDESKDLPYGISYKVYDNLFYDESFLLEIIEAYRDYAKDNKYEKYYPTSHGEICITSDYSYGSNSGKIILCFLEDLENMSTLKIDFDNEKYEILW